METHKGLKEVITKKDGGKPFNVNTYKCSRCGGEDDYLDEETRCHNCNKQLTKKKVKKTIHSKQTKEIINTKLRYQCPKCKKEYDRPTICCNEEYVRKEDDDKYEGFMCMGCKTIYRKIINCCSGSMMIRGDVYPKKSIEAMKKIQQGLLKPISGIIQR
jgi:DNA-directed RNA polymerase subunit RPC12/RpoP